MAQNILTNESTTNDSSNSRVNTRIDSSSSE